jgi:hypothetical protein
MIVQQRQITAAVPVGVLELPVNLLINEGGPAPPTGGWRRRSFRADGPSKKRPHRNGDLVVVQFDGTNTAVTVGAGLGTALRAANSPKTCAREQDKHLFIQKDFAARGNRTRTAGLSLGEKLPQEKKMRIFAVMFGAAAVLAVAAPVAADPATGRLQLAQAQDSGSQSGSSTGARQQGSSGGQQGSSGMSQQGSGGQREGGSATNRQSSGGAAVNQTQRGTSRTSVRERSEGVAVRGGSRTTVGVRSGASDDVIIHRKKARRYVYHEPSTTIVRKKKRYVRYHDEPSSVMIHKRRTGVAVGGGSSTRTTVRSRTSTTTVGGGSSTRESVGAGGRNGQGAAGQGNAGAGSSTSGSGQTGRAPSSGSSGSSSGGGSSSGNGSTTNRPQ